MAARKRLLITDSALRDLGRIYDRIAATSSTKAMNQMEGISYATDMLPDFPSMGRDRSHLDENLRSIIENPFVIFYYMNEHEIVIARVFHQREDIEQELVAFLAQRRRPASHS